jgi:GAF domain-containing protein
MAQTSAPAPEPSDPTWAFAELGRIVLGNEPLGAVLERIAVLAAQVIPAASEASVTLMEDGKPRSIAFTGPNAGMLDERQYETGWGPCLDAAVTGETVLVDTTDPAASAYPDFATVALRVGVVQSMSVGLPIAERVVGAVNLFSWSETMDESAIELAERFAGYAAVAVVNAAVYSSAEERAENMVAAMQSRAVIEQAKGIIMATRHCDGDDAFAYLVKASQQRNRKLRDIAAAIVASTSTPGQHPGLR